jgi:hypothetical protein
MRTVIAGFAELCRLGAGFHRLRVELEAARRLRAGDGLGGRSSGLSNRRSLFGLRLRAKDGQVKRQVLWRRHKGRGGGRLLPVFSLVFS